MIDFFRKPKREFDDKHKTAKPNWIIFNSLPKKLEIRQHCILVPKTKANF